MDENVNTSNRQRQRRTSTGIVSKASQARSPNRRLSTTSKTALLTSPQKMPPPPARGKTCNRDKRSSNADTPRPASGRKTRAKLTSEALKAISAGATALASGHSTPTRRLSTTNSRRESLASVRGLSMRHLGAGSAKSSRRDSVASSVASSSYDLSEQRQLIRVALRVRPSRKQEDRSCIRVSENRRAMEIITSASKSITSTFSFDAVFEPTATQQSVYESVCSDLVDSVCEQHINATLLAYGPTGTGKTHTMMGSPESLDGMAPEAVKQIFQFVANANSNNKSSSDRVDDGGIRIQCEVHLSACEIYNEQVYDLLSSNDSRTTLKIRENRAQRGFCLPELSSHVTSSEQACLTLLQRALQNRIVSSTKKNEFSSRSHVITTIEVIETQTIDAASSGTSSKQVLSTKMNFVDLAGSEKYNDAVDTTETNSINTSLACLGHVINALTSQSHHHIPYRDSALTKLLKDSLGGASRTLMIACVDPGSVSRQETLNTIRYAQRAKKIKNRPQGNEGEASGEKALVFKLYSELHRLKEEQSQVQHSFKEIDAAVQAALGKDDDGTQTEQENKCCDANDADLVAVIASDSADAGRISIMNVPVSVNSLPAAVRMQLSPQLRSPAKKLSASTKKSPRKGRRLCMSSCVTNAPTAEPVEQKQMSVVAPAADILASLTKMTKKMQEMQMKWNVEREKLLYELEKTRDTAKRESMRRDMERAQEGERQMRVNFELTKEAAETLRATEELDRERAEHEESLKNLKVSLTEEKEAVASRASALERQLTEARAELAAAESNAQLARNQLQHLQLNFDRAKSVSEEERTLYQAKVAKLEADLRKADASVDKYQGEVTQCKEQLASLQQTLEDVESQLKCANNEISTLQQQALENDERHQEAILKVMEELKISKEEAKMHLSSELQRIEGVWGAKVESADAHMEAMREQIQSMSREVNERVACKVKDDVALAKSKKHAKDIQLRLVSLEQQLNEVKSSHAAAIKKDELKVSTLQHSLANARKEYQKAQISAAKREEALKSIKVEFSDLKNAKAKVQASLKGFEAKVMDLNEQIATLRSTKALFEEEAAKHSNECKRLHVELKESQQNLFSAQSSHETEVKDLEMHIQELTKDIALAKTLKDAEHKNAAALELAIDNLKKKFAREQENMKTASVESQNAVQSLQARVHLLEQEVSDASDVKASDDASMAEKVSEISTLQKKISSSQLERDNLQKSVQNLQAQLQANVESKVANDASLTKQGKHIIELEKKYAASQSTLNSIRAAHDESARALHDRILRLEAQIMEAAETKQSDDRIASRSADRISQLEEQLQGAALEMERATNAQNVTRAELEKKLAAMQADLMKTEAQKRACDEKFNECSATLAALEKEHASLRIKKDENAQALEDENRFLASQVKSLIQQVTDASELKQNDDILAVKQKEECKNLQKQLSELRQKMESSQKMSDVTLGKLRARVTDLLKKVEVANGSSAKDTAEIDKLKKEAIRVRHVLNAAEADLEAAFTKLALLTEEKASLEEKITLHSAELARANADRERTEAELAKAQAKITQLSAEVAVHTGAAEERCRQLEQVQQKLKKAHGRRAEDKATRLRLQASLKQRILAHKDCEKEMTACKEKLKTATEQLSEYDQNLCQARERCDSLKGEVERYTVKLDNVKQQEFQTRKQACNLTANVKEWKAQAEHLRLLVPKVDMLEASCADFEERLSMSLKENEVYRRNKVALETAIKSLKEEKSGQAERLADVSRSKVQTIMALSAELDRLRSSMAAMSAFLTSTSALKARKRRWRKSGTKKRRDDGLFTAALAGGADAFGDDNFMEADKKHKRKRWSALFRRTVHDDVDDIRRFSAPPAISEELKRELRACSEIEPAAPGVPSKCPTHEQTLAETDFVTFSGSVQEPQKAQIHQQPRRALGSHAGKKGCAIM